MSGLNMVAWLLMQGAALVTPAPAAMPEAVPPAPTEVTALAPDLKARVHRVVGYGAHAETRLQRLGDFVFDADGLALQYSDDRTRTVAESVRDRKVNCLSFSLLFVALAREAGLDAYIQETDHALAWYADAGAVYRSGHVNVGVRIGARRMTVDIDQSILMTRGPPRRISDERALAHFYNNRGAELIREGHAEAARDHLVAALKSDPGFIGALNNLGVLDMRGREFTAARRGFQRALDGNPEHAATLYNLVSLFKRTGEPHQAEKYGQRLARVQQKDPFHQILLAMNDERQGDFAGAVGHYRHAIRLFGDDDRLFLALALAYIRLGDTRQAAEALTRARDVADAGDRDRYQAKLDRLRSTDVTRNKPFMEMRR